MDKIIVKRRFTKEQISGGWKEAYHILIHKLNKTETETIFDSADKLYHEYIKRYQKEKGIRKGHVMCAVSVAALYMSLSSVMDKNIAISIIEASMKPASIAKHKKIERLPAHLFMKIAGVITSIVFGEKAGFKRKWHCNTNREKKYDLLTCPYVETLSELGCPEVCPAVCIQDDISFGNMKNGVVFERAGTLGRGDHCCDFCFKINR